MSNNDRSVLRISKTRDKLLPLRMIVGLVGFQTAYSSSDLLHAQVVAPQSVSMEAAEWNILYSPSMPAHPKAIDRGWYFDFPSCNGSNTCSVHYVTVPVNLSASTSVRAAFQIAATGTPAFHYKLQPDNMCDHPAHVRYILQRRGDDLISEFYRWFSAPGFKLEEGSVELSVPLRPDQWISVFGKRGDYNENARNGFHEALQDLGNVGFVFGGGCFLSHGVNVIGGSARFQVTEFSLN